MLQESFNKVYTKFKLQFYTKFFERTPDREEATLTTVETFCMEIIHSLKRPTVNEFAVAANVFFQMLSPLIAAVLDIFFWQVALAIPEGTLNGHPLKPCPNP